MNIYHVEVCTVSKKGNVEHYFNSLVLSDSRKKATVKALEEVEYYGNKKLVINAHLISDIEGKSIIVLDDDKIVVEKSVFENLRNEFVKAKDLEFESKILEHLKPTNDILVNLNNMLDTFVQIGDTDKVNRVKQIIKIEEDRLRKGSDVHDITDELLD